MNLRVMEKEHLRPFAQRISDPEFYGLSSGGTGQVLIDLITSHQND